MSKFSIDRAEIDVECPKCRFATSVTLRQIRVRDVFICRGCKASVQLDDHMNEVRKAERDVRHAIRELSDSLTGIGKVTFRI